MKAKGIVSMPYRDGSGNGLSDNKGFTLPANIGELGDDITTLDLRYCSLTGPLSTRSERFNRSLKLSNWCARTGELPLEIIRMKAKGVDVCREREALVVR